MTIQLFSSGSCGNCCLIKTNNHNILIDVGISKKQILENLAKNNLNILDIDIILITHAHDDHIRSLGSILKIAKANIYMSYGTYMDIMKFKGTINDKLKEIVREKVKSNQITLLSILDDKLTYNPIILNNIKITPIPTFHDATESVGYIIECNGKKIVYITDTGFIHYKLFDLITNANCYVIESNYDPYTLMHSSRPESNKMRTLSNHGHLSNEDAMVTIAKVMGCNTKLVIHAHVSQECNLSQIIIDTREKVFDDFGIDVSNVSFVIASPNPTKEYEI